MCLIIFAHQIRPQIPLVLAANRDEFFSRPTQHAAFWESELGPSPILAGKDLKAGGTWIGIALNGRFAAVTNIRGPLEVEHKPLSRGHLTLQFLLGVKSPAEFANDLTANFTQYAEFNLLLGDKDNLVYVNSSEKLISKLQPGIYGLSNGLLNSNWPKVNRGREEIKDMMEYEQNLTTDDLITMMYHRDEAACELLPETGIPIELEQQLSSSFVTNPERNYGTLCSTAIIISDSGLTQFNEQNYDESGSPTEQHYYEFHQHL
jgi:uncharacterized protein with NRDE domain